MSAHPPSFHDGYVKGVRLDDASTTIYLQQSDGTDYEVILEGVEALQIDEFRESNIVSRVMVVTSKRPDSDCALDRLFWKPHPSAAKNYHEKHARLIAEQTSRIERGETTLFIAEPSFGADLLALCKRVAFRKIGD